MPNWKKVIVSGSDASLNSLNVTAGVTGSLLGTASYALNADLLDGKDSTVFATTGSNTFVGNQIITGSLFTTGSNTLIGSTTLTGSLNVSGSTLQVGNNTLLGNTTLSGSIIISGSTSPGAATASVQIYGDIRQSGYHRFDPVTTNIDTTISASYIYVSGSTNDLYFSQNGNGYSNTTRLRWIEGNLYTGLLNGGLITTQSSTVYQVSSGSGVIVNLNASFNDNPYPTVQYLNWPNLSASIAPLSASYDQTFVAIDNTSNIFTQGTPYNDGQFNTTIPIGVVVHQNRSTINGTQTFASLAYGWKQRSSDFIRAFGPLKLSGFTLSASGSSTGSLVVASGTAWSDGRNYTIDPNNPSYITDAGTTVSKIFRYRQSGSAAWVYDTNGGAGYPTIDPTQYSNNGVLTPVTGSGAIRGWSIQRVYWFPNSVTKGIYVYYGNNQYPTDLDAIANINIESFTEAPNTAAQALYLGSLILRNNATFTDSNSYKIIPGGLFRSVGGSGGGGSTVTTTLSGLSDVNISGPTDGQALIYDSTALKWENSSFFSGSISGNAATATTASYAVTASYVATAQTASYVLNAVSASFASTASYVNPLNQNVEITGSASNSLRVKGSGATSATNTLYIENSGNTASLVVRDDARVGINTTTPSTTLHVNGNTTITGSLIVYGPNNSINLPIYPPTYYYPTLTIASTTFQGYQTSGNIMQIANTGYMIEFGSSRGYMLLRSAGDHYLQSGASNLTRLFISSSGRIGIAKSSSLNATLDIIGSQVITGSLEVSAGITGSFLGTASYATQALTASNANTASYVLNAVSSSFASTASYVNPLNQNVLITGSASNSLRVKGSGATSATNTLYLENSSNINTFAVADNGNVTVNTGSLTINQATGAGTGIILKAPTDYYSPKLEFNAIGGTSHIIQAYGGPLFLNGGNYNVCFGVYNAAGTVSNVNIYTYPYGGSQPAYPNNYSMLIKNPDTTGVNLMVRAASGQAGTGSITEWQNSGGTEVVAKITASGSAYFKSDITASSFSGSHIGPLTGTASYATTALTASFASTASFVNPLNQNVTITGSASNSLRVKGSGTTSATNTMLVENSAGTSILTIADNGNATFNVGTGSLMANVGNTTYFRVTGSSTVGGIVELFHTNGGRIGRFSGNSGGAVAGLNIDAYDSINFNTLNTSLTFNPSVATSWKTYSGYNFTFVGYSGYGDPSGGEVIMKDNLTGNEAFHAYLGQNQRIIMNSSSLAIGKSSAPNAKLDITGSALITGSLLVSGSSVVTGSFTVFTGSAIEFQVLPTGVKIGNVITDVHTVTGSLNVSGSVLVTGSLNTTLGITGSSFTGSFTGSLLGTASYATTALTSSFASTASFVNPLNQNVLITGSLTVSSSNATQLQVGSNLLYVNNSNDVGIGTTSPSSYLGGTNGIAIVKPVYAGISLGTTSAGVNSNWLIYKMYNGQLSIYETTAARERFTISYTGEVGVGGPSTAARLIVMGAGSTSATTTFQVENSSAAKTIQCKDNQSIGFFGATTVTQPTTAGASSTFTSNPGVALNDADTYDGYTIAQVVKALRQLGLLA